MLGGNPPNNGTDSLDFLTLSKPHISADCDNNLQLGFQYVVIIYKKIATLALHSRVTP